jgi:hypothetical protein
MALQTINLGTYANDGTGDDLRTAFNKVNANLTELYSALYGANVGSAPPISGVEEGELWWSTEDGRLYIRYGTSWVDASPVPSTVSDISNHELSGLGNVANTTASLNQTLSWTGTEWAPQNVSASGNFNLNGHSIISSSSFGINSNGGGIGILAINPTSKNYNSIYLNGLELSGGNDETGGEVSLSAFTGINLSINSDSGLTLYTVNDLSLTGNRVLITGDVTSTGNINTSGNVSALRFIGNITGDSTGLHTGNVVGNVVGNVTGSTTGTHTGNVVGNVVGNTNGSHVGNVTGDITGNVVGNVTGDITGSLVGDIYASNGTTKILENGNGTNATFTGTVNGDVNGALVGDIYASNGSTKILENGNGSGIPATFTGNTTGVHTGTVIGTVSDISNHDISALGDVSSTSPIIGQALVWSGSVWSPGSVASGGGTLDFGTFTAPAGFTLDMGTF